MNIYISGKGMISPIGNGEGNWELPIHNGMWLPTPKVDVKNYVDAIQARRLSNILKMSLVAANHSLLNFDINLLKGILVGTGIGCISDSEKFICSVLQYNEESLSPTPFIQSTHNTIAGFLGLFFKNHGYNITFSERIFSFEWALLDAYLKIKESHSDVAYLVGAADELTQKTFDIAKTLKLGHEPAQDFANLYHKKNNKILLGEHTVFFNLTNTLTHGEGIVLSLVKMYFKPNVNHVIQELVELFSIEKINISNLIIGVNGLEKFDGIYKEFESTFNEANLMYYKHLCGESFVSSSFAMFLGCKVIEEQKIPAITLLKKQNDQYGNVLIVNHFRDEYLSVTLLKK